MSSVELQVQLPGSALLGGAEKADGCVPCEIVDDAWLRHDEHTPCFLRQQDPFLLSVPLSFFDLTTTFAFACILGLILRRACCVMFWPYP
jgi:hypothetical protein